MWVYPFGGDTPYTQRISTIRGECCSTTTSGGNLLGFGIYGNGQPRGYTLLREEL